MRLSYTSGIQGVQLPQELITKGYLEDTNATVSVSTGLSSSHASVAVHVFKCKKPFSIRRVILIGSGASARVKESSVLLPTIDEYTLIVNQTSNTSSQSEVLKQIDFKQDRYYCIYTFNAVIVWWVWNFVENTN